MLSNSPVFIVGTPVRKWNGGLVSITYLRSVLLQVSMGDDEELTNPNPFILYKYLLHVTQLAANRLSRA